MAEGAGNAYMFRRMKHVYGKHCLGRTAVNNWRKHFRQDRQTIKDLPKPVGGTISDAPDIKEMFRNDRRLTTSEISEQTRLNESKQSLQEMK